MPEVSYRDIAGFVFFRFRPKISFYISVRSLWPSRSVRYFFFGNNFVFRTMAAAAAVAVLFPLEPNLFIAVKFETKQATNEPPTSPIHSQRHTGLIQHFVIRHNTHTHTPKAGGFHHFFCPVPRHHHHTTTTIPPPYHHHTTTIPPPPYHRLPLSLWCYSFDFLSPKPFRTTCPPSPASLVSPKEVN